MQVQPLILAAGKGTRMGNAGLPKVLTPLQEKPLVCYLLETVQQAGFLPAALVVGFMEELVREQLGDTYTYISQKEQLGTGHAVRVCEDTLAGKSDVILVMNGDHPLWSVETLQNLVKEQQASGAVMTLATLESDQAAFANFGRIIRDSENKVKAIREQKDCSLEELEIKEYNPALYCFSNAWLWPALQKLDQNNAQGEYYVTDLLDIAVREKAGVSSVPILRWQEALGVNTPEQLREVEQWLV